MALKYGGDVVAAGKAGGGGRGGKDPPEPEQDEDEAQLDPEILALIEKEVGGKGGGMARAPRAVLSCSRGVGCVLFGS